MEPSGDALNANTAKDTTLSPKAFRLTRSDSSRNGKCCPHNEDSTTKRKKMRKNEKVFLLLEGIPYFPHFLHAESHLFFFSLRSNLPWFVPMRAPEKVKAEISASKHFILCPQRLRTISWGSGEALYSGIALNAVPWVKPAASSADKRNSKKQMAVASKRNLRLFCT